MPSKDEVLCRRKLFTVAIDVSLVGSVALVAGLIHLLMTPHHRGFYCDDNSIQYPFHDSTISSTVLYLVGFGLNFAVICVVEGIMVHKGSISKATITTNNTTDDTRHSQPSASIVFLCSLYKVVLPFLFGVALEFTVRGISKYTVGRLRPHFLSVCQPDFTTINCSGGYVENYECTSGNTELINQARLSFPSGHASFSVYSMVFLMLYIQTRMKWRQAVIVRPFIQLILFTMAFYTCISRVVDYKHHWSDVLAGAIWGLVVAVLMVFKVSSLFPSSRITCTSKGYDYDVTTEL